MTLQKDPIILAKVISEDSKEHAIQIAEDSAIEDTYYIDTVVSIEVPSVFKLIIS